MANAYACHDINFIAVSQGYHEHIDMLDSVLVGSLSACGVVYTQFRIVITYFLDIVCDIFQKCKSYLHIKTMWFYRVFATFVLELDLPAFKNLAGLGLEQFTTGAAEKSPRLLCPAKLGAIIGKNAVNTQLLQGV